VSVSWDEPGATALVVPAPEAEPALRPLRRRHAAAGAPDVHAHVTLIVPFAPAATVEPLLPSLEELVGSWRAAPFTLRRVERWPRIVWLDPEPAAPLAALTAALIERFPDYLPYGGVHEEVIPHVTVAAHDDERVLDEIAALVEPALPIACAGDTVQLLERGDDLRWRERRSWPLAPSTGARASLWHRPT
jgi:2'-5' RNA ligase